MCGGSRHPRVDHDHVGAVEFLAFKDMLKRNRMRFRGLPPISMIVLALRISL